MRRVARLLTTWTCMFTTPAVCVWAVLAPPSVSLKEVSGGQTGRIQYLSSFADRMRSSMTSSVPSRLRTFLS